MTLREDPGWPRPQVDRRAELRFSQQQDWCPSLVSHSTLGFFNLAGVFVTTDRLQQPDCSTSSRYRATGFPSNSCKQLPPKSIVPGVKLPMYSPNVKQRSFDRHIEGAHSGKVSSPLGETHTMSKGWPGPGTPLHELVEELGDLHAANLIL